MKKKVVIFPSKSAIKVSSKIHLASEVAGDV